MGNENISVGSQRSGGGENWTWVGGKVTDDRARSWVLIALTCSGARKALLLSELSVRFCLKEA